MNGECWDRGMLGGMVGRTNGWNVGWMYVWIDGSMHGCRNVGGEGCGDVGMHE